MKSLRETFQKTIKNLPQVADGGSSKNRRTRQAILPTVPLVLGLPEGEAAVAVGVSPTKFRELVAAGIMPAARIVGGKLVYDVDELRLAFKSLPHQGGNVEVDTWADVTSDG